MGERIVVVSIIFPPTRYRSTLALSKRSAFAVTMIVAPVSARMAIHKGVKPAKLVTRKIAFSPRDIVTFWRT
ncbi:MAG: hypothetical protein JZU55_00080, partial [Afipia sp.]|nr:hypothetical protein [Afipia sp.]